MFNILIFGMNDNPGGVESFLMNYARNFDKTKIHMDFLCNTKVDYAVRMKKLVYLCHVKNKPKEGQFQKEPVFFPPDFPLEEHTCFSKK